MKRWSYVTVALYALLLLLLTAPVTLISWLKWHTNAEHPELSHWQSDVNLHGVVDLFQSWSFWLWLGVLVSAQALLLLVPVDVAERRPTRRRRLLVPVVTVSFLLANLFLAGVFAILSAAFGDKASVVVEAPAQFTGKIIECIPGLSAALANVGLAPGGDWLMVPQLIGMVICFWLLWGCVFHHFARADEPETLVKRTTRWLLRGSILELLVAVPSHIIVRQREDCCAPMASFWGIVTGISVMLLSFGPGVFFLFAARMRGRRPRTPEAPPVIP
jgi:hypothetical protein